MVDLSREKELVGQIKAKTMPKTMEISLQESKALKRIINGTLSDWDRQHNNWAVEYLKKRETEQFNGKVTLDNEFCVYYNYWLIDRISSRLRRDEIARENLYLISTGFYVRFSDWFDVNLKRALDEIEASKDSEADDE